MDSLQVDLLLKKLDELQKAMSFHVDDRLVRMTEAGRILGVNANMISSYVKQGLLKPVYTPNGGGQQKFWVSQLHGLVSEVAQ